MKQVLHIMIVITALMAFVPSANLFAGSNQATTETRFEIEEVKSFAKKVEKELAKRGTRVAVIARLGRDRSELPEGVNFTHVAFAVYSQITTSEGRKIPGYTMYNLYQRGDEPDRSDLVRDFPVDFFAGVTSLETGIIIPTPELQRRLLAVLASPTYKNLHEPDYSVIANPFTPELQNCTEHTLDVLTAAIYQTDDERVIKANLKAYYEPQKVYISPTKLMLGSIFVDEIAISDHPDSVVTATFTTISRFLTKYKAAAEVITFTHQPQRGDV